MNQKKLLRLSDIERIRMAEKEALYINKIVDKVSKKLAKHFANFIIYNRVPYSRLVIEFQDMGKDDIELTVRIKSNDITKIPDNKRFFS